MPPRVKRKLSVEGKPSGQKPAPKKQPRSFMEACIHVVSELRLSPLATPFNQVIAKKKKEKINTNIYIYIYIC
jgi:hypothetical protein